jgi:thiamine biosynthesis protein ThiS
MRSFAVCFAGEAARSGGVTMNLAESIQVQVNGERKELRAGISVRELLDQLGLNPGRVAIEYNLEILPKTKWEETRVAAGDRFEIVQFVGGG